MPGHARAACPRAYTDTPSRSLKMKGNLMNTRTIQMGACIAIYLLGIVGYAVFTYRQTKDEAFAVLDQRLLATASAVVDVLGRGYHDNILDKQVPEERYMEIVQALSHLAATSGLTYVYSMVERDGQVFFTSCSATKEELENDDFSAFFDEYDDASDILKQAFLSKKASSEIATDKWGTFKSVFVPMTSPDGTAFIVGADISIDYIDDILNNSLITSTLSSLFFILLLCPLLYVLRKFTKQDKQTLTQQVELATNEVKKLNKELESKIESAQEETTRANQATEEARVAREQAETARREGMLSAAARLENVVHILGLAVKDLDSRINRAAKGAGTQIRQVGDTAAATERMNDNVNAVLLNANQAFETTENARCKAQEGADIVTKVMQGVEASQAMAAALKGEIGALGRQAEDIGHILEVISDIADQTNLLALNAAIEAARAGDAGRGFAVVADEVRKLAEKTMSATREVGEAIQGIQHGATKNISSVEHTVTTIQDITELSRRSGDALSEIVSLVRSASDQVQTIVEATQEQSAASVQISTAIGKVDTISGETSTSMAEAANAVSDLTSQANTLNQLLQDLKADR